MTDLATLDRFRKIVGCGQLSPAQVKAGCLPAWSWRVQSRADLLEVVPLLLRDSVTKRKPLLIVQRFLSLHKPHRGVAYSKREIKARERLADALRVRKKEV